MNQKKVITRFAPSPTGFLHIGGVRTALFAWAFARHHHGKFVLRIEDTDFARSDRYLSDNIIQSIKWLKLDYDLGPIYQSDRLERYLAIANQLIADGFAYRCYCTKEDLDGMREKQKLRGIKQKYDRRCLDKQHDHDQKTNHNRPYVIRFKNPQDGHVVWNDLVKGRISINNQELDDLIIVRSDGVPTYNFCVVVDDIDMHITDVIRGDDHINNTPRQINIYHALGAELPNFAHLPMILNADGEKMSKRKDAVDIMSYANMGILPDAIMNYLARLCWGNGNLETFKIEEFIQLFRLQDVSPSPARFDLSKLYWINAWHMINNGNIEYIVDYLLAKDQIRSNKLYTRDQLLKIIPILINRHNNINDLDLEISMILADKDYSKIDTEDDQHKKHCNPDAIIQLVNFANYLEQDDSNMLYNIEQSKKIVTEFCTHQQIKISAFGMAFRLAICMNSKTPSLDIILALLDKNVVINRIKHFAQILR